MLQIDPYLATEPRVDKTICRIRRDTVRSHDKTLYRDTMWIIFKRGKMHGAEVPGIYFEITPWGFQYGFRILSRFPLAISTNHARQNPGR